MKTQRLILQCEGGLHLRVAAKAVREAQGRRATLHVDCEGCPRANACSILELLKLGAARGTPLELTADGPDEEEALRALTEVFTGGGGI
ncbi:MAG: HPr family phosphocarrier protein [Lentisphaerae bacterium]|nr:HPr family phosphocarrier protein [Lentisphaerota bacterium]